MIVLKFRKPGTGMPIQPSHMVKRYNLENTYHRIFIYLLLICGIIFTPVQHTEAQGNEAFRNPNLPVDQRVIDLLSRMTIEEKIAQMDMISGRPLTGINRLNMELAATMVGANGVGSIHDFYPASPDLVNELQLFILENNRFEIPALILEETLHGYVQQGSTTFPIPLALASTWNPDLIEDVGHAIASEARAQGTTVGLSPVLGIARDPRWGRVEETFGEDTYLVSVMGLAMVEGFQGENLNQPDAIASCVKHFAMHSMPVSGTNSSPVSIGQRDALQFFLPPFQTAVLQGGARGVMTAYSEWNSVPCTGDSWLLTDLLRDQWGFTGFTLADMGAIRMLSTCHFATDSPSASLQRAVAAGVDMQFYDFPSEFFRSELLRLVQSGELDLADIDRAAGNVLRLKFELGLFENPYVDPSCAEEIVHCREHRELSLEAARESIVLLQNDGVLPLDDGIRRIAVVGPSGENTYTGGYSPRGASAQTILDGLQEVAGDGVEIRYIQGVSFIDEGVPIPHEALWTMDESVNGLDASYYSNINLEGNPEVTRIDSSVNFAWDTHSPVHGLPPDSFSVRWEGWLVSDVDFTGWIGVSSDDGSRLWLDDELVIDTWETGVTIRRYEVHFHADHKYKIRMEYRENQWGASAGLRWNMDSEDIDGAVQLAEWSDVVIVAAGENDLLVGENRDRLDLGLSGNQSELLRQVSQTGIPVILVLQTGRPVTLGNDALHADAVITAWFGGEYAGKAIAEVLFGEVNPSGRLPITFPRTTGQIPCYYNRKPSRIMRYSDGDAQPQYPFGHGLSYSCFEYSNLTLEAESWTVDDTVRFSVEVENGSDREGTTVVQVYINDLYSSVTTPLKELKAFERVTLEAGERRTVHFEIPVEHLSLVDEGFHFVVEPGEFELMVGESSADIRVRTTFRILDETE